MTDSTKETSQSQQSQTSPWSAAQPLLDKVLAGYGGQSTAVTPGQSTALANLTQATAGLPNFGDQGTGAINNLFNSNNSGQVGMLNTALDSLKTNLGGTASGANLNPYETPGFSDALKTMTSDITNATKGVYAGSGRDPSGAGSFAGSLGRGLTQGLAPTIASQYNQNYGNMINANNQLFSGAGSTASGISNLNQTQLQNGLAGIQGASTIPGLYTSPAQAQLAAANAQYSQPYSNLAALLQPSTALAGLGSQSSGTGNSTSTSTPSLMDSITSGMGTFGKGASGLASLLALMPSDERIKENKAKVGALHDGTPVYSFNYIGDKKPQIGLMAQDLEKTTPEAVTEIGGLKHVNYDIATRKARAMGRVGEASGMSGYLDEMLASLRDMAPESATSYPTSQPMEKYIDYSQGWPQEMTRPKAQFGDIPTVAPAGPAQIPQMQAQAPLAGLEGTLGANPAPFSLAGPSSPSVSPSLAAAREMTAQPPIQPGGGLPPMPPAPAPGPDGGDAGGPTSPPAPASPPSAPAPAPMSIAGPAVPQAEEPSFLQKLSSGAKSFAPALLGMGAALQGDQGHMTTALMNQQQGLAEQQQTQNITAKALQKIGVDPDLIAAAVRQPEMFRAIVADKLGKSKYKIQVLNEDQFGGKTYGAVNENDPTDVKTFVPGKGFVKGDAGSGDAGAGGVGDSASGPGYLGPGVSELDPSKTGDEFLSQFSPLAQAAVKSYINGDSQPTSNPRKGWAENIKKIAQKYGGDMGIPVNDQLFYQKKNFLNSLGNTNSGVGMQVKGFQQGLHHLGSAADSLEKMGNWGGFGFGPLAEWENRARQLGTGQAGQAAKAAGEIQALAGETGKLFSGSAGGGVGERAETRARFDTRKSPTEIAGALEGQLELMMGGLQSLEQRRDDIFGPNGKDVRGANFLGPKEQAEIARVRGIIERLRGGGEAPTAAAPVPVASKADYDKLPAGSPYIAPDGSHRVKK